MDIIDCFLFTLKGEPLPEVAWKRGNKTIKAKKDNGVTIENVDGACVLSITDCKKADHEGTYTIEVTNSSGTAKEQVKVVIEAKTVGKIKMHT